MAATSLRYWSRVLLTCLRIDALVKRIREAVAQPIKTPDGDVVLTSSVGVAVGPAQFKTPEDVIAAADRAMYAAKRGE